MVNGCKEGNPKADGHRTALNSLQCPTTAVPCWRGQGCHIRDRIGCTCTLCICCKRSLCHLSCGVDVVGHGFAGSLHNAWGPSHIVLQCNSKVTLRYLC